MRWLLLGFLILSIPARATGTIDPGVATGWLVINGDTVRLMHAYAQVHDNAEGLLDRPSEMRIVLCDREIPQASLSGIAFLPVSDLAREGRVRGLLLAFDPANRNSVYVTLLDKPAEEGRSLITQTLSVSGDGPIRNLLISAQRVGGELEHADSDMTPDSRLPALAYAVSFSAPVFNEPAVTEDLKGKAAKKSVQVKVLTDRAKALARGDLETVKRLSTAESNRQSETMLAGGGDDILRMAKEFAADMQKSLRGVKRVVVRGDRAVVIFGDKSWTTMRMENGEWKGGD